MADSLFAVHRVGSDNPAFEVVNTGGAVTIKVDNTQILAERQAAVSDATDTTTAISQLNLVIDALEAHGLIIPNGE